MELKYKSWKEISINTYNKLMEALQEAPVTDDVTLNNLNQEIAILSVLCDVDEDEIASLTQAQFIDLVKQTSFLQSMPKIDIKDKYTLNGKKYELFLSLKDMTMAQYIDFQTLYKDQDKYFRELLACFIIPKGCKYGEGYNIDDAVKDIGEYLSIVEANSIMFFFALLYRSLTQAMLTFSIRQMKKAMRKEKDKDRKIKIQQAIEETKRAVDLAKNGDGSIW